MRSSKLTLVLAAAAALLATATLVPTDAHAYSVRVHVYGANLVLQDVVDDGQVDLGAWGTYPVDPDVAKALELYPSYFRAGAVGPDGYPDIFTGQAFTHGDQSPGLVNFLLKGRTITCPLAETRGWCQPGTCASYQCSQPNDKIVPYAFTDSAGAPHKRPRQFWRSIDWAHALIDDARGEVRDSYVNGDVEQTQRALEALAFAFGYLMHYAGDSFAHQWVNLYAEGAWDYFDESYAPEYRHVTLERYLEHLMGPAAKDQAAWTNRRVDVPVWFVRKYLVEQYIGGCTLDKFLQLVCTPDSAADGAAHIRFLLGYRQALEQLLGQLPPAPTPLEFTGMGLPAGFDVRDPSAYSSIWSYMVNRCINEVAVGGFLGFGQSNCMTRIYEMAIHTYVKQRLARTDLAIDQWIRTSNAIVQDMLDNGLSVSSISAMLTTYRTDFLEPMFIPGANEPLRLSFGISCADAGPKNFEKVCEAMMGEVRKVFAEAQDAVEAAFNQRMKTWIDAYERYLCALDKLLAYYTQPELMMDYVFCGQPSACARSLDRKAQIQQDVLATGSADDFMPFMNTVALSKLALVEDQGRDMDDLAKIANAAGIVAGLIDPTQAAFVQSFAYERILYESVASLDGEHTIEENVAAKGGVQNPKRVVYDQFRKVPRFAWLLDDVLRRRLYEPFFRIVEQDPDGDQIILAYDLCPCVPEVLADNGADADGDRVGDACDPETRFESARGELVSIPPWEVADPQFVTDLENQMRMTFEVCATFGTAAALVEAARWYLLVDDAAGRGTIGHDASVMLIDTAKSLTEVLRKGGMACVDRPLPQVVSSCL